MATANGVLPPKAIRQAAARAFKAGISIVPPAEDGTKRPDARWKQYQERLPNREEMRSWYGDRHGLGFVCGAVSGGLELLEFDDRATYEAFKAAAEASGLGRLVERIEAGYLEETPGDGVHWLYRTDEVRGNTKLAERPDKVDPNKRQPLIETRGDGGYVVVAPSGGPVHPTGNSYVLLRGGADSIVTITGEERDQLWGLARTFDEMPPEVPAVGSSPPRAGGERAQDGTTQPGDDYAARTPWSAILPAGWHLVHTHGETQLWRRPDKAKGWSATVNHGGSDCLYVFSSSTAFKPLTSYTKFGAYAQLHHGGNFQEAAKALAAAGYGTYEDVEIVDGKVKRKIEQNPRPKAQAKRTTAANGDGNGTAHVTVEAGDDGRKVCEAPDDPHRLARGLLDERYRGPDGLELRYYQGEHLGWNGAYRSFPEKDIRAQLTASIKSEFNRLNIAEIDAWERRGKTDAKGKECPPPVVRKVTSGLVNNAVGALAGETLLHHLTKQPSWLTDAAPFPADEVLPARNALVHLPGFVAGEPGAIMPPTPRFFGGHCLDYDFDADAAEPINWLTFLGSKPISDASKVRLQLWPDDPQCIDTLQEWMGYHLLPDTRQQKIAMVIGPRRCGKGTIARVLTALLGPENVANPTLAGLASHFGLNSLINKPCAIIPDARLSGKTDAGVVVEHLLSISGEDAQTIDRKHLGHWNGLLPTRFTFISNELPRLPDTSGALTGRMIIFRLTRSFYGQEDKGLTALLKSELPGILLWAIEGWLRLRERGHFLQPDSGQEMIAELEELSSPVGAFLKERCIVEPGREIIAKNLYSAWKEWCAEKGREHPGDDQVFGRNLRTVLPQLKTSRGSRQADGSRPRTYQGIDLQLQF